MEIAFFTDPVANIDMKTQPQATCPRQEFSFLLAAMLKSAQQVADAGSGLLEAGSIPVSEEGESISPMLESGNPEDTAIEGKASQDESTDEAALEVNMFAPVPFANPVQSPEVRAAAPNTAPGWAGNEVAAAAVQKTAFFKIEDNDAVAKGVRDIKDSAVTGSAQADNNGKIEISEDLLANGSSREDFEIEIPTDEILKQAKTDEPMNEAAFAAVSDKEAALQKEGKLTEKTQFDVSFAERDEKASSVEKNVTAANEIVQPLTASCEGFETSNRDASEEEVVSQGASVETQPVKPEAVATGVTFDNTIEQAAKPAPAARMTTATAEVHEKVQAGMKVSIQQDGGEVKMKLNPDSLGEVRIRLNVNEGMVRAEITVDNPEVKRIIEADSSFLRESLGAQGLTLDKCVVEVGRSFDASYREDSDRSQPDFNEQQRPMKDRDEDKGNNGWHRHFRNQNARHEEGGVDFFA